MNFAGPTNYLGTQDDAVAELATLATTSNRALLCYDVEQNFCHRSMVAVAVKELTRAR